MTLRTRLIEAGTERIHDKWHKGKAHVRCSDCPEDVRLILDAFLAVLSESADEWNAAAGQFAFEDEWAQTLLAVLQGEPE
jgi:hypothetical protein